ncbi:lipid-A-disaccharide synthase [Pantoea sp. Aalb]|uniref:lipid-A-disaccharide synthase n=1 Tax=Pantoea sp. Aalb TaxID=2576762 RepID=UPI00132B6EEF|nr:lipid-A-disaccharide synthase [Pantoea sp. Aalb]MXP67228.1 lipid-A-disaccharide synthase [Pantoea sp. Aalb]
MLVRPLTIACTAGEISGDILGAGLIRALKARYPKIRFVGVPGPHMRKEGCEAWYKMEDISVMGIVEVTRRLVSLLKIRYELTQRLTKLQPDVFIGIDAPDFNITIEGNLKRIGIRTIHYVSPSIWAWRQNRIFKIKRNTNLILVLFPFEKKLYDLFNVPCKFIGHPIADYMPLSPNKLVIRRELGISKNSICLALLPGSRSAEVEMLSADFIRAAQILYYRYPLLEIIVPLVNYKHRIHFENIKSKIAPKLPMYLIDGKNSRQAMRASDATIITSGTATLECMLAKCPMVVGYRMNLFNFWIAKFLVKTNYIALPNLLAGEKIVTELLQNKCNPLAIVDALEPLIHRGPKRDTILKTFNELHQKIRLNADEQAADAVLEIIKNG